MKIYFSRHGESLANTLRIISNRDLSHTLTERGREQAASLARNLAGRPLARIFSSPVPRAVETAGIVAQALSVPLEITNALREYDCGILEGRGDEAAWAIHSQFWRDWSEGRSRNQSPPGGETFYDIQERFGDFVNGLVREFGQTETEFLCISHGGTYTFGLPGTLANVDLGFVQNHSLGHTVIITAEVVDGKLTCTAWDG
ncbi:MAG: histidine phosphatase family protein [Chloroflexi bacterium]|nr:MAG: histidine phosphatase family protein [Chloroflexota bacterium]